MNPFRLYFIRISALISVILIYIRKLKERGKVTPNTKRTVKIMEINDLFDETTEKNEIKTTDKVEQKEIRVKLKNKTWWKRNHYFFLSWCAILFITVLIFILSSVTYRRYNSLHEISIQKEYQKKLYEDSIQNNKGSIKNEQIKLISSEVSDIDKIIRETNKIIRRVEKQIKNIGENDF